MRLSLVHIQTTKPVSVKPNQALWCHSATCRWKTECCGTNKSDLLALVVLVKWKTMYTGGLWWGMCSKLVRWSYNPRFKFWLHHKGKQLQCSKKLWCCRSKHMKVKALKTEADKYKLHLKILQWLQAQTFQETECATAKPVNLKEKNEVLITWEEIIYKATELANSHNFTQ